MHQKYIWWWRQQKLSSVIHRVPAPGDANKTGFHGLPRRAVDVWGDHWQPRSAGEGPHCPISTPRVQQRGSRVGWWPLSRPVRSAVLSIIGHRTGSGMRYGDPDGSGAAYACPRASGDRARAAWIVGGARTRGRGTRTVHRGNEEEGAGGGRKSLRTRKPSCAGHA